MEDYGIQIKLNVRLTCRGNWYIISINEKEHMFDIVEMEVVSMLIYGNRYAIQ